MRSYYYYCKNTIGSTGHKCTFRTNIEQTELDNMVAAIISAMVNDERFEKAIKDKIGCAVDTADLEKQLETLRGQLRQAEDTKSRLEQQMDTLDVTDAHYDRKILDLQRRYDDQYDRISVLEEQLSEIEAQIRSIRQEQISSDNVYQLLLTFDQLYAELTEPEKKEFMRAIIERIDVYPEKRPDGCWIRNIVFNFPVPIGGKDIRELPLENSSILETVAQLVRKKPDTYLDVDIDC